MRSVRMVWVAMSLAACSTAAQPAPEQRSSTPPTAAPRAQAAPAPSAGPVAQPPRWKITPRGVADLQLGASVREPGAGFAAHYHTDFYADAQPLEGFMLDDPPAFAVLKGGPFAKWGAAHPGQDPPEKLRSKALAQARAGRLTVDMIVVTDPRPQTERGAAVGIDYADFAKSYPASTPTQLPALWEEPSCVARDETVWFFFDQCSELTRAKVIRIVIRPDAD